MRNGVDFVIAQSDEALAAFQKAQELDPTNRLVRANAARARAHLPGQIDKAVADLQELVRSDPKDTWAQQALDEALFLKRDAQKPNAGSAGPTSKTGAGAAGK